MRAHKFKLAEQVRTAERNFRRRGLAVAAATRVASGIATCQRGKIHLAAQRSRRESGTLQPYLQHATTRPAERLILQRGEPPRRLADEQHTNADVSAETSHRVRLSKIARD